MPTLIEAARQVKEGAIGNPYMAKAWYANNRKSIGYGKKIPVPPTLNFELWQGPAPRRDYQDNLVHYNWHWFWHWGTGEACNNGTHEIDCCRWFLGVNFPQKVVSAGGRYAFKDDWQTPDTQIASYEFAEGKPSPGKDAVAMTILSKAPVADLSSMGTAEAWSTLASATIKSSTTRTS